MIQILKYNVLGLVVDTDILKNNILRLVVDTDIEI